jgi:peptidoglycan-N-acetylmuramic acid deacetylase
MKKRRFFTMTFLLCAVFVFVITAQAADGTSYSWYFKKNDTHTQPQLDKSMEFIEDSGAWYIDRAHSDTCSDKVLYLTFDAGYSNENVEKILDVLRDNDVPGAFFVLKHFITSQSDLVVRMANEGHLICNHTMSHKNMSNLSDDEFKDELLGLEQICRDSCGIELAKYYRPPEGRFSQANLLQAKEMGYKTIFWSFAYADWDNGNQPSPEQAKKYVLSHTHNGAVILLHPTSSTNAAILQELISAWKNEGYRFGTLDELTCQ